MTGGLGRHALAVALAVSLALIAVLLVVTVGGRAARRRRERRDDALAAAPRRRLYALAVDDVSDPAELDVLVGLDARTWRAVEPTVVSLLGKLRGDARGVFVTLLGRRGAVDAALARARRGRAIARARSADLLGVAGGPGAVAELTRLLGDRDRQVRAVAVRGLGRIADPAGALPIVNHVNGRGVDGRGGLPHHLAAQALLRIGEPAVAPLRTASRDARPGVRGLAVQVLGLIGAVAAVDDVVAVLEGDPVDEVRVRAARALGAIGSPRALPALVAATSAGAPPALRTVATAALGEVGATASVAPLAALMGDPAHAVAHHAAVALAGLGPTGVAVLTELACDPADPRARDHARDALAARGGPLPEPAPDDVLLGA